MQSLEKKIPWTLVERLPGCMLLLDYLTAVLAAHVALSGTAEIARRFRESPRLYQFLVQTIVSAPAIQPGLPPPPSVAPAGYVCSARPVIDAALGHVSRQARNVLGVGATRSDRSIGPPNLALAILDASMDVWQPLLLWCRGTGRARIPARANDTIHVPRRRIRPNLWPIAGWCLLWPAAAPQNVVAPAVASTTTSDQWSCCKECS
ncbi:hypothetical protein BC828DRAFT_680 [Blastocladiella britannica]|nr:hypothetical protein BC828DRAFT_680 [Blastocladiella britannica]